MKTDDDSADLSIGSKIWSIVSLFIDQSVLCSDIICQINSAIKDNMFLKLHYFLREIEFDLQKCDYTSD